MDMLFLATELHELHPATQVAGIVAPPVAFVVVAYFFFKFLNDN